MEKTDSYRKMHTLHTQSQIEPAQLDKANDLHTDNIIAELFDDKAFVVNLETEMIYTLNEIYGVASGF